MTQFDVTVFEPYPFQVGQKIRIEGGKRHGDWEVMELTEKSVKLRCPISQREFEWARFCYKVEERKNTIWPKPDE